MMIGHNLRLGVLLFIGVIFGYFTEINTFSYFCLYLLFIVECIFNIVAVNRLKLMKRIFDEFYINHSNFVSAIYIELMHPTLEKEELLKLLKNHLEEK